LLNVFVINLDRHLARWERLKAELADPRIALHRIRAFDGTRLPDQLYPSQPEPGALDPNGTALSRFEVGCLASHRFVWRKMVTLGLERAVVLEDDIYASKDFVDVITDEKLARAPFDIVKLEKFARRVLLGRKGRIELGNGRIVAPLKSHNAGAAGYILTRAVAERLVTLSRNFPTGTDAILFNFQLYRLSRQKPFAVGQIAPAIVIQHDLRRDGTHDESLKSYIGRRRGKRERPLSLLHRIETEITRPARQLEFLLRSVPLGFE